MSLSFRGNAMATIVIKNLPESLHLQLKERARRHHRSLNKEAIALIEQAVSQSPAPQSPTDALAAVFAAGDALQRSGMDAAEWAAHSREVWR
jgi:plasmid stability protein